MLLSRESQSSNCRIKGIVLQKPRMTSVQGCIFFPFPPPLGGGEFYQVVGEENQVGKIGQKRKGREGKIEKRKKKGKKEKKGRKGKEGKEKLKIGREEKRREKRKGQIQFQFSLPFPSSFVQSSPLDFLPQQT